MKVDQDIYRYARFIYTCDVCTTRFVVWVVPNKDWKTGVKAIKTKIDVNIGFGPQLPKSAKYTLPQKNSVTFKETANDRCS
jgi:hypothetical protein